MQIPHNLKLRLSDCGKAIETSGLASVTVAQMNPCGSLDKDENAMLGNLLASAPDLLRQRDAARRLARLIAEQAWWGDNETPGPLNMEGRLRCILDTARAILAETEAKP